MYLTDSLEYEAANSALEGCQQIAAKDLHSVGFADHIPKAFKANGCLGVPALPEYGSAFAASRNTEIGRAHV